MDKNDSFDSEKYSYSDNDSENVETKARTSNIEKEDEIEFKNIDLIKSISQVLETIIEDNKHLFNYTEVIKKQSKNIFSSRIIPKISIKDYLTRIHTYTHIEKNTLILSLIYIDRLCKISKLTLTCYNIHRILFTSILISIKYNEDTFYDNKYYSEIAGVSLKELNNFEYTFVSLIHFLLYVKDETFKNYETYLNNSL